MDNGIQKVSGHIHEMPEFVKRMADMEQWKHTMTTNNFSVAEGAFVNIQTQVQDLENQVNVLRATDQRGVRDDIGSNRAHIVSLTEQIQGHDTQIQMLTSQAS